MEVLKDQIFNLIQKQGIAFVLICVIAYIFYTENDKLKETQIADKQEMSKEIQALRVQVNDCNRNTNLLILNELQKSTMAIEKFNEKNR